MIVNYKIYGNGDDDDIENNTSCSFFTQSSLTLKHIRNLFPYEGIFHFRAKVIGTAVGMKYPFEKAAGMGFDSFNLSKEKIEVF